MTCPECHDLTVFEQPPCDDGHGGDCPEWFCVSCGHAVIEGEVQLIAVTERSAAGRAASAPRLARPV